MEIIFALSICLVWHALLVLFGVWLGTIKPWRKRLVLVDRAAPSPTARQGKTPVYYAGDGDEEYA